MTTPQSGILPESNKHALFLNLRVLLPASQGPSIAAILAKVPAQTDEYRSQYPDSDFLTAVSFGADLWDHISPDRRPEGLRKFKPIINGDRSAPATGGDFLIHIRSERADLNFEFSRNLIQTFNGRVDILEEVVGFRYHDSRDLTGFVDGTANPKEEQRKHAALIGNNDPIFEGGSMLATQRYVHDLAGWQHLTTEEQEQRIGRTKQDNIEFPADRMPPTSHLGRVIIEEDGKELKLLRHSMPYGDMTEAGLYFVAYANTLDNFEKILTQMVGQEGDVKYDHMLDFTKPVSGAYFFTPSLEVLSWFA